MLVRGLVLPLGLIAATRSIAQENQSLSLADVPVGIPTAAIVAAGPPPDANTVPLKIAIPGAETDLATSGAEAARLLGSVLLEAGFAAGMGNRGRFQFEVGAGKFLPVTREILVKTQHGRVQLGNQAGLDHAALAGLTAGQYQAPTFEFLIADAPPGFPVSPSNFRGFPFLLNGEGARTISGTALTVGPLSPFPPSTP